MPYHSHTKEKLKILEKVRPQLMDLERQRRDLTKLQERKIGNLLLLLLAGVGLIVACVIVLDITRIDFMLFALIGGLVIMGGYMEKYRKSGERIFRQTVGETVLKLLQPDWKFDAHRHLPSVRFEQFGITRNFNEIKGSNLIHGKHGDTEFSFSHVHLTRGNGDGQSNIFEGLIVVADFHKEIKGKTLVFPDVAQKNLGGWLGKKVQEFGWKGLQLVYMEDPAFEKAFAVYSSSQIEARYILTPVMMTKLVELSEKYDNNLSFSFYRGKVCIALKHALPFETSLRTKISPDSLFHRFNQPIDLVTEMIDILNLNTRLWSKE